MTHGNKKISKQVDITVNLNEDANDGKCHFSIKEVTRGKHTAVAPFDSSLTKQVPILIPRHFSNNNIYVYSHVGDTASCKIDVVGTYVGVLKDEQNGEVYINEFINKNLNEFTYTPKQKGEV